LLLLAIKTFSGRLQRCTGNVESWFRLFGQKENKIITTLNEKTPHILMQ